MRALTKLRLRLLSLFRSARMDRELGDEFRFHLEQLAEENRATGMKPDEARNAALRALGHLTQQQEECRDMRRVNVMDNFSQDFRYGFRTLGHAMGFTVVAVLTLALGIGSNAAIFSVVSAALLRPLPYSQPDRLITIGEVRRQRAVSDRLSLATWNASYPDYLDWSAQAKTFQSMAGFTGDGFTLRGVGEPETVNAAQVTPNFFATLGIKPLLGRDFRAGEEAPNGPYIAILTNSFWKNRFAADPQIVGRSIRLDTNNVTIVGVLPPEFEFAPRGNAQLWVPLHMSEPMATRRNLRWLRVIGRLSPNATPQQAEAEMDLVDARLTAQYPQANGATQVTLAPLRDRILGRIQPLLLVLLGAVGFVLLIACANVANLLTARATHRRREFAVRTALGAGRSRLLGQLLCESLILAAAGAALGVLFARYGTPGLVAAIPQPMLDSMPYLRDAHADPMVLSFVLGATLLIAVTLGFAPALGIKHRNVWDTLKDESRASAGGLRTRLRHALVVVEVAFSLVLLVGAGLMMESLSELLGRNPGFDPRGLLTFSVFLPQTSYPQNDDVVRFYRSFGDRVRAVTGVQGVASTSVVPLTGGGNTIRFVVDGRPTAAGRDDETNIRQISSDYFSLMKIPLVAGRIFNDLDDTASAPRRVIVNNAWLKRFMPGEQPLGKRVRFTNSPTQPFREIVGVVGDYVDASIDAANEPILFTPYLQGPSSFITYMARTIGDPSAMIAPIRAALHGSDPELILIAPASMDEIITQSSSVFLRRYPSFLIGSFAGLALVLAMIGLYGLISYSVSQRTREVGIRIALGARPRDIIRLVVWEGARLTIIGIGAGVLAALALTRLMQSLLFGVSAADPFVFATISLLLILVAAAACYIPARRATRTNPISALRYE